MIETKQLTSDQRSIIEQYKAFGWEETGEIPAPNKKTPSTITLNRDTDMAHYKEIKVLENTFEGHLNKLKKEPELDYGIAVFCFILLIIPGMIYLSSLRAKKARVQKENEQELQYMKNACVNAKKIRG